MVVVTKPDRKPTRVDQLDLWLSKGREIDGLWVGTSEAEPYPALRRVEEALQLIKQNDPLNYSRVIRNLDRVWVHLIPSAEAHYKRSLNACIVDERYVLNEAMTLNRLASTIVHEATHARLEGWGIIYEERSRRRIEAICLRRELNLVSKLPDSGPLREEIVRALEWCATDHDHLSDSSFRQREERGQVETLRYLNAPNWLVRWALWVIWKRRLRSVVPPGP